MKTAAKIFIIVGMILGFWMVFPIILGAIALSKLEKDEMTTGWIICVYILVSSIAGVILLCMTKDEAVMKTAAKVFIIVGMVVGFWMVFPIVLGAIALSKLNEDEMTTGWMICTFLLVSWVAGTLLFYMAKEEKAMQILARVFIIVGMVTGFWTVLPIVFGAIALSKLGKGTVPTGWSICTYFFVDSMAGALLLCMPETENN